MSNPIVQWDWYNEAVKKLEEQEERDKLTKSIAGTGFQDLDLMLNGGFKAGELVILSAPTKQGKSTLAQTISWNMAEKGTKTLWFTMEMSWQELTSKFRDMDEEYKKTGQPSLRPIHYPLEPFLKAGDIQMQWLKDMISEAIRVEQTEFVIIDHLHFLLPLKDFNTNISFLIGGIVREIKKIAVELKIPIMLIAHTTKLDIEKTPDINSIRDSSFIAQEADFVMIMWRIRDKLAKKKSNYDGEEDTQIVYTNKAWLSLEANRRNGKTGRIKLWHNGSKFNQFVDTEKQELEDMVNAL